MYLNKVILMGFLGGDAVVRTSKNNKQFTTLSLATKESRKDKETGKYNERTEWHNLIVFGKLGEFAAKLKKGAHIQIEGQIQHSEYKGVKTDTIRSLPSSSSTAPSVLLPRMISMKSLARTRPHRPVSSVGKPGESRASPAAECPH